jgi:hypothetical protein
MIIRQFGIHKIFTGFLSVVITFGLTGCAGAAAAETPASRQDIVLAILGFFLFTGTIIYAAYKAFVQLNVSYSEEDRIDYKSRAIGFFIGLLLTALIIAADTEQSPFSTSRLLTLLPWYLFSCLGALLGFTIALASSIMAYLRNSSGSGMVVLVLSFIGSTGLYISLFSGEARAGVFSLFISILIGVLAFRMLFPAGLQQPTQEEAR